MATLAELIAQIEGYNTPGTIANRLNNPGNLRYGPNQSGTTQTASGTFATYSSADAGWNDLQAYINNAANQGLTLRQFVYKYAPPTENDTTNYLNFVSNGLGVSADTPLSQIVGGSGSDSTGVYIPTTDSGNDPITAALSNIDPTQLGLILGVGVLAVLLMEG